MPTSDCRRRILTSRHVHCGQFDARKSLSDPTDCVGSVATLRKSGRVVPGPVSFHSDGSNDPVENSHIPETDGALGPRGRTPTLRSAAGRWRLLRRGDASDIREHFDCLSEESFRQRFGSIRSSSWITAYAEEFFDRPGFAVGYFRYQKLVAVGEVRPSVLGGADVCEFGVSVSPTSQGQGLGLELAIEMSRRARDCGFRFAEAFVDHSNRRMVAMLHRFEGRATRNGGTLHFRMSL